MFSPLQARLLPVLPLRDIVLLPGMIARVHVMRPTAVSALEAHLAQPQRPLAAVPLLDPAIDELLPEEVPDHGCSARVVRAVRLGDGTVRVLIEGVERVKLSGARPDAEAGILASARVMNDVLESTEGAELLAQKVREGLRGLIKDDGRFPAALEKVADLPYEPGRLADLVGANLTLTPEERVELLAETGVDRRLEKVALVVHREWKYKALDAKIQKDLAANMDKQQREYYLREQIRAFRKELGEGPAEGWDDTTALEQKLREAGMPPEGLEEALREIERLRRMHPDAAEYTVTRNWLDWLLAMPWKTLTDEAVDMDASARVLDEDHYGLLKVKERILEYLAVKKLKPEGKGPILCFIGPPGVGKTSLGRSIARALGRKFQRVSLGGVKDEAEIRGHRRTYVGALPGRVVHALKRAGSRNPVIVLDEVDKLGNDFRGDPASALLEVLDPEQNNAFMDHYLDVPLDLSQVLFLCTANLADPIPPALHDRLEIIEIPGYILEEKLEISRVHLLPRLREEHGLAEGQLTVTEGAARHVIEAYTAEAGLRGLERQLANVHRKFARQLVEGRSETLLVDSEADVRALLGPPRHFQELAERADAPGVAIGLAWTASGGDILFIEATRFPSAAPGLKLTGQLGDVMKESGEAALSLVRSRAQGLNIDPEVFGKTAFHLHVPAGGIPKDGPSAGVTMVTALASLLTGRKVRSHLAMSGEITLRGKVLPVGGVKEKVLAARRAGVREVVLPRHNQNDLEDVPQPVRDELTFHFVDTIEDVLALGLEAVG